MSKTSYKTGQMSKRYNTRKEGIKLKVRKQARKSNRPWRVSGWGTEWRAGEAEVGEVGEKAEEREKGS